MAEDYSVYKEKICNIVEESHDLEFLIAVYSFVSNYPDRSRLPHEVKATDT